MIVMIQTQEDTQDGEKPSEVLLPEKPIEPLDSECCGTGCSPCVFDIYKKKLSKWELECERLLTGGEGIASGEAEQFQITPFEYKPFLLTHITTDNKRVKILKFNCSPVVGVGTNDEAEPRNTAVATVALFPVGIGQHVAIRIGKVSRKYTVLRLSRTGRTSQFEVAIKIYADGPTTQLLNLTSIGSTVEMRGPFGHTFEYEENRFQALVMLAAGTGIAPMYRIIEKILKEESDETRIKLLFSCKDVDEIIFADKLKEWGSFWNFQVFYYFSSSAGSVPYGMEAKLKRLDQSELSERCRNEIKARSRTLFLICGTNSFEKDMMNHLRRLNVDDDFLDED